ncbi:TIGR00341 family protein [Gangjinia marincola]|uniref:TIGR00341 family protein n=1 Tax=Gangjinia marincola TaxID=578463 RepID=A0ABP3XYV6_9FLAO
MDEKKYTPPDAHGETDAQRAEVAEKMQSTWDSFKDFLTGILNIAQETDKEQSIEDIKKDIPFRGHTAWILVFAIFVASIGLNANSTAVVIGAMLISPLMGPIVGMGMSIAINDLDTLRRSLINFGVMVVLSVFTAFLFFWIFPLDDESSELLARTSPDVRDVLIAFFGGLALVIAKTKKGLITSVIVGVAIATALMPPLCTAGFGLAIWNLEYFFGAMYLFTINTIFIALSTFIVLKILRFPMQRYANSKRRRRISQLASLVAILVTIPAIITFVKVYRESNFKNDVQAFIENELSGIPNAEYIKRNARFEYNPGGISTLTFSTFGLDQIPDETVALLQNRMRDEEYSHLDNTLLQFKQNTNKGLSEMRYMQELRARDSLELMSQTEKIVFLESRVRQLSELEKLQIPFEDITNTAKINYEGLKALSFSNTIISTFDKIDTVPMFSSVWYDSIPKKQVETEKKKLATYLRYRLKIDSLIVQ